MKRAFAVALLLALPATAVAGPLTAGVSLGMAQSKLENDDDAVGAQGVFGRLRLGQRLGLQLELGKIGGPPQGNDIRSASALLVVDLLDSAVYRIVPTFIAGVGVDRQRLGFSDLDAYDQIVNGKHVEGGIGVEYRSDQGITIGLDLRVGSRELDDATYVSPPVATDGGPPTPGTPRGAPIDCDPSAPACANPLVPLNGGYEPMPAGEYRSARLTIGIAF